MFEYKLKADQWVENEGPDKDKYPYYQEVAVKECHDKVYKMYPFYDAMIANVSRDPNDYSDFDDSFKENRIIAEEGLIKFYSIKKYKIDVIMQAWE
jgi:hypothetical protein